MNKLYYEDLGHDDFEDFMSDYDVARRRRLIFDTLLGGRDIAGLRVLEVGSGTGRFSRDIVARGATLTVLDIGETLVNRVVSENSCDGVTGDACVLPFLGGAFDAVISSECIEHTPEPLAAIREMCRVCAPAGTVCVTTPNRLWYPVMRLSQKIGARKFHGIENWIWAGRASDIMKREGMTTVRIGGCHLWPFQLKFTRPLLQRADALGSVLHPLMINFGIAARKGA